MSRNPAHDKVMKARREADARMRAAGRLDEPMKAQKETAGLLNGEDATRARVGAEPELSRPVIASQGIDKNLSHQARLLGTISDDKFEQAIADACDAVMSATRAVIRAVEIEQEGADLHRARAATARGGM
jgi:hypothetical protein